MACIVLIYFVLLLLARLLLKKVKEKLRADGSTLTWGETAMSATHLRWTVPVIGLIAAEAAFAVPITAPYDVTHNYRVRLVGNQVVQGAFAWNLQAHANPPVANNANVNSVGPFPPPNALVRNANANGMAAIASADANCTFNFPAPDANGLISGSQRAHGHAKLDAAAGGRSASASSLCATGINRGTTDGRGNTRWSPEWTINSVAAGSSLRVRDPIDFSVFNLDTFLTIDSQLFSIALDMTGPGSGSWADDGTVNISGLDGSFSVIMDSPYITSGTGSLEVQFANGLITTSNDSGVFDGMLPAAGTASTFSLLFPADIDIDFDFGSPNTNGYDFKINLGALGEASLVPEPGSLALLGTALAAFGLSRRRKMA